jgi:predicted transposase YbfD/YdcC
VDREVIRPNGTQKSLDTRYFISSLDPGTVTPADVQRLIRGHWQVENGLHWVKDRWWDEDKHYLKRVGNIFIALTNTAVSLLNLLRESGENRRELSDELRYSPRKVLQLLGFNKM